MSRRDYSDGLEGSSSFQPFDGLGPNLVLIKLQDGLRGTNKAGACLRSAAHCGAMEIRVSPSLDRDIRRRIQALVKRACLFSPAYKPPDFRLFFSVEWIGSERDILEYLVSLPEVELAQMVGESRRPKMVPTCGDPCTTGQGYLRAAPEGIGAEDIWMISGGEGQNVRFVDIEEAWSFEHEEIADLRVQLISGVNGYGDQGHGTAVLGIVAARRNGFGIVGAVPCLDFVGVSSVWETSQSINVPLAVVAALEVLRPGDVLLIELETGRDDSWYPIERDGLIFELIRLGSALGIIVVEPAGNGVGILSDICEPRMTPGRCRCTCDSGAIIVGACSSKVNGASHELLTISNYGQRVDCYAWGESVYTARVPALFSSEDRRVGPLADDCLEGYGTFSATSAAGAIVAGAVACIQGVVRARFGCPLSPGAIRNLLRDVKINTPVTRKGVLVGVMPDLCQIVASVLKERRGDNLCL